MFKTNSTTKLSQNEILVEVVVEGKKQQHGNGIRRIRNITSATKNSSKISSKLTAAAKITTSIKQ